MMPISWVLIMVCVNMAEKICDTRRRAGLFFIFRLMRYRQIVVGINRFFTALLVFKMSNGRLAISEVSIIATGVIFMFKVY